MNNHNRYNNYYRPNYSRFNRDSNSNSQGNSYQAHNPEIDISNSTLQPTALEFRPSSSSSSTNAQQYNNGAVRRNYSSNRYYQTDKRYNNKFANETKKNWSVKKNDKPEFDNWRRKEHKEQNGAPKVPKKIDAGSQRERLEEMISRRLLECLVCCEKLRNTDKVWSCKQCYHIMHLNCTIKWAQSSKLEDGWRCPACQNLCTEIPKRYYCYCGKFVDPKFEPGSLAHSCGDICGRRGRNCTHNCTLRCHPGPCPDCTVMVKKSCGCGATSPMIKCSADIKITCKNICGKMLNCTLHKCEQVCHVDDCDNCVVLIKQACYCGKENREVNCSEEEIGKSNFECENTCRKGLSCGNHFCEEKCHPGDCKTCVMDPTVVTHCPCGNTKLEVERKSCLDLIPCCDKICHKKLMCGQPSNPHLCKENCHPGNCPPCPLYTMVRCRCGHMDREVLCKELTSKADDARCQKKCTKKRMCFKHKCNQLCCIEVEHPCPLPCNHLLSCGLHRCEENCHRGQCSPCWRTSFEELYCECGSNVLYPPVACGTRPPPCSKPCSRVRSCGHEPYHNCHTGPCPPCVVFTTRWCHGEHEKRQTIPCHQEDFSCGLPCNKDMICGHHKCNQICHRGECPLPCTQPCTIQRSDCEHMCNQPCHAPPCPNIPCKQSLIVTCQCGLRSSTRICMDLAGEFQKIAMLQIASKMADVQRGQAVDLNDFTTPKKGVAPKMLECTEECRLVERNRRLAIGLQIRNPDLSSKLTPRYSDFMKGWAKKDPRFCQHVHDKLTELVQLAKQSKQKSRSFSFECMKREKREFVHEYCEHFGCESAAYDKEPNRNIVATAYRDRSWLPGISLIQLLQRENGQRKVPGPVLNKSHLSKTDQSISVKLPSRSATRPATPPGEYIDYFDNPP